MSDKRHENITEDQRQSFYRVLYGRRDVRANFLPDAIDEAVLTNILHAAHHAPSVGFSQPWNFIVISDNSIKQAIHAEFQRANNEAALMFEGDRRARYSELKLQGILESPINICVTCDRERNGPVVLGRTHQADTDIYSTVCAVQNLWLAARAENIGVGWVSIIEQARLAEILQLPDAVLPVAYLCLGHVSAFNDQPELQQQGWEKRAAIEPLIYSNLWGS